MFLAVCLCLSIILFSQNTNQKTANIYVNNELYGSYVISDVAYPYEFTIKTDYGYNTVRIENGKIGVIKSDCPDKTCINSGSTDSIYKPVICMPHRLEITISEQ